MFEYYSYDNTIEAEQYNTLLVIDRAIGEQKFNYIPEFHLVGGTALIFHGVSHEMTIDIDTGNRIGRKIKDIVDPLINDNASEVIKRGSRYVERLIPYKEDIFKNIKVYLFSIEDLIISKCATQRNKDLNDIIKTGLVNMANKSLLKQIIEEELNSYDRERVINDLRRVCKDF